jgi:hypothetical protein
LQLVPRDQVDVVKRVERDLHARLLPVLRGGVCDGSQDIDLPVGRRLKVVAMAFGVEDRP